MQRHEVKAKFQVLLDYIPYEICQHVKCEIRQRPLLFAPEIKKIAFLIQLQPRHLL